MSPLNTVLDDSIGCALWFAALGVGRVRSFSVSSGCNKDSEEDTEEKNYTSKAKVKQLCSLSLENENVLTQCRHVTFHLVTSIVLVELVDVTSFK